MLVKKPKNFEFEFGDYLCMIPEELEDVYYNLTYAQVYKLKWDPKKIKGFVARHDHNYGNRDRMTIEMTECV